MTKDEILKSLKEARSAAWYSARSAARYAAEYAARSAARSAAWDAAEYAAWSAKHAGKRINHKKITLNLI
jgi:hypothetical protein